MGISISKKLLNIKIINEYNKFRLIFDLLILLIIYFLVKGFSLLIFHFTLNLESNIKRSKQRVRSDSSASSKIISRGLTPVFVLLRTNLCLIPKGVNETIFFCGCESSSETRDIRS